MCEKEFKRVKEREDIQLQFSATHVLLHRTWIFYGWIGEWEKENALNGKGKSKNCLRIVGGFRNGEEE